MSKKLMKYIAILCYFSYIGKTLIVLFKTSGGISIIYFTSAVGVYGGIASASFDYKNNIETVNSSKKQKRSMIILLC